MSNQEFMINTSKDLSYGHIDLYCKDLYCANIKNVIISPSSTQLNPQAPLASVGTLQPVLYDTINHNLIFSDSQPIRFVTVFTPGNNYSTFVLITDSLGQPFNQSIWFSPILSSFNNNGANPNADTTYAIRYSVDLMGYWTVNYYNNGSSGVGDSSVSLLMVSKSFGGSISS